MFQKIKLAYKNNRNIFRIVRYTLISFILLVITWILDYQYSYLKNWVPDILLLSPEVTSSFLSNLTGTFLTVSTFTLTTILTVLNKYSDSFTPRILQDFIDEPNVLSLFSVFIGGFFYTVLSLFLIQNIETETPLISGTIGVFYAVAAMISFILFVRRVLKDIRVSNVIEKIYKRADHLIEEEANKKKIANISEDFPYKYEICSKESGYLYDINSKSLLSELKDLKGEFVIQKRVGEFILENSSIGTLFLKEDLELNGEEKEEWLEKLSDDLVINFKMNDTEDYHEEMTNLVEIAMRSLSPAINDPNTGIVVLRKIGLLLGKLFSSEKYYKVLVENETLKIIYKGYTAKEEMQLAFNQILHYGKSDPHVAKAILESVHTIYLSAGSSLHSEIEEFFNYCYHLCQSAMDNEEYRIQLEKVYQQFFNE